MSDDPLKLGGIDADLIDLEVSARKTKTKKESAASVLRAETAAKKEERLEKGERGGGSSSAPPPPPMPPPPESIDEKSELLDKIQAYRERFPQMKSRNKLTAKSGLDEIKDELHYIEQQLGQKEGHVGHQVFQLAMTTVEEVTTKHYNPLGLNLVGLSQVAKDNEDQFTPILDELFIKYATNMYVGPEMRLVMATATLMYTVHSANSGNPKVARAMSAMSKQVVAPVTDL